MNITINIGDKPAVVEVMRISESSSVPELIGRQFVSLRIGDLTLILDGFDQAAATQARQIAAELSKAADEINPNPRTETFEQADARIAAECARDEVLL